MKRVALVALGVFLLLLALVVEVNAGAGNLRNCRVKAKNNSVITFYHYDEGEKVWRQVKGAGAGAVLFKALDCKTLGDRLVFFVEQVGWVEVDAQVVDVFFEPAISNNNNQRHRQIATHPWPEPAGGGEDIQSGQQEASYHRTCLGFRWLLRICW